MPYPHRFSRAKYGTDGLRLYNNIVQLLEFLIGIIATMGLALITEKTLQGESIPWREALQHGLSKWGRAIGTSVLAVLILLGLTLLLIIPGIIYTIQLALGIIAFVAVLVVSYPLSLISTNPWFSILPNTLGNIVGAFFTITGALFFLNHESMVRARENL